MHINIIWLEKTASSEQKCYVSEEQLFSEQKCYVSKEKVLFLLFTKMPVRMLCACKIALSEEEK